MNLTETNKTVMKIRSVQIEIENLRYAILCAICPDERRFFEICLFNRIDFLFCLIDELPKYKQSGVMAETNRQELKLNSDELSAYNGMNGKPAYVAVNGVIYDVSNESTWGGASHFGLVAGKDLTVQFNSCHKTEAVLSKLPKVGILK